MSIQQQVMPMPENLENYAYRWHMPPSQSPAAVPGLQQVTAALHQSKSETFSYAETTWINVDEKARETLRLYGRAIILRWTGKKLDKIIDGQQTRITIRDARMINSKVSVPVFNITAENVVKIPSKKGINVHRMLDEANNEPIFEIKIKSEHREKLRALLETTKQQLIEVLGQNFENILGNKKTISRRHATMIHTITRETIFDLGEQAVQQFSTGQDQPILSRSNAVQGTEEEVQELPEPPTLSKGTKRPLPVSPGDPASSRSKKQRTDDNDQPLTTPDVNAFPFTIRIPHF